MEKKSPAHFPIPVQNPPNLSCTKDMVIHQLNTVLHVHNVLKRGRGNKRGFCVVTTYTTTARLHDTQFSCFSGKHTPLAQRDSIVTRTQCISRCVRRCVHDGCRTYVIITDGLSIDIALCCISTPQYTSNGLGVCSAVDVLWRSMDRVVCSTAPVKTKHKH